jgi:hypothetical protein
MSITKQSFLNCNGKYCKETTFSDGDCSYLTGAEQRKLALSDGWIQIGSKDYCQHCASIMLPPKESDH